MERELRCPVCKDLFKEPVKLYCHHHICADHLSSFSQAAAVSCPSCSESTPLPAEGGWRVDRALLLVVEAFREERASSSSVGRAADPAPLAELCGYCEEKPASRRCAQCDGVLCTDCEKSLHSKVMFKNHVVMDLDGQSFAKAPDDVYSRRMLCDEHADEKLSFYCDQCQRPVCSHCLILGSHKGHRQQPIDKALATGRESLTQWEARLCQHGESSAALLERLRALEREVQGGAEAQRSTINSELDRLKEALEAKREQLLTKSALEEKQKRVMLQAQMERAEIITRDASDLAVRSSHLLQLRSTHPFLALVLPLIQDMQRCARQPIETNILVSASFQPLSAEAARSAVLELDLGQRARRLEAAAQQVPVKVGSVSGSMPGVQPAKHAVSATPGGCAGYGSANAPTMPYQAAAQALQHGPVQVPQHGLLGVSPALSAAQSLAAWGGEAPPAVVYFHSAVHGS